jgi:hypothetical protein
MSQELKVDTRRIPNRFGDDEITDEPSVPIVLAEPVAVAAPEPVPPPVEVAPIPRPVFEVPVATDDAVMEIVDEPDEVPPPPSLLEVEYWWEPAARESNGHTEVAEPAAGDWMPEPVIHPHRW